MAINIYILLDILVCSITVYFYESRSILIWRARRASQNTNDKLSFIIVGGDRGVRNSRLPYLLLPLPAPFNRGSRLFVLFLLSNVTQYCEIFLLFSRFPPLWESRFPPFLLPLPVVLPPLFSWAPAPLAPSTLSNCLTLIAFLPKIFKESFVQKTHSRHFEVVHECSASQWLVSYLETFLPKVLNQIRKKPG